MGFLFQRINHPQVMGETVAGIVLGPSLPGWLAPGVSASLFPPASLSYLNALTQEGPVVSRLSDDGVTFTGFALFMGAAMSITAFPVDTFTFR